MLASSAKQTVHASPRFSESTTAEASACGKVIVAGEHAVVYGKHAIALPIPLAVQSQVTRRSDGQQRVRIAAWGLKEWTPVAASPQPIAACLDAICHTLQLPAGGFDLDIQAHVRRGSGLGGSAALAVATARALAAAFRLHRTDEEINAVGLASEQVAHGKPSGVDNTVATYAQPLLFRKDPRLLAPLSLKCPLILVIGFTGVPGMTFEMVSAVAKLRQTNPARIDALMAEIDAVTLAARDALQVGDITELGALMNTNHGLLTALGVSTVDLDRMVHLARHHGAVGAKLTGGGGGGAMIALCSGEAARVAMGLRECGYEAQIVVVS